MISTLLFGTFMKPVQKCLVPPSQASAHEYDNTADEIEKREILRLKRMESDLLESEDLDEEKRDTINHEESSSTSSEEGHSEVMLHPNQEKDVESPRHSSVSEVLGDGPGSFSDSKFALWFMGFDDKHLGPFLIRNHNKVRMILDLANQEKLKVAANAKSGWLDEETKKVEKRVTRMSMMNIEPKNLLPPGQDAAFFESKDVPAQEEKLIAKDDYE